MLLSLSSRSRVLLLMLRRLSHPVNSARSVRPSWLAAGLAVALVAGLSISTAGAALWQTVPAEAADSAERARPFVIGEITELSEARLQVRPWNPNLPRRMVVSAATGARYYEQKVGSLKDVQVGDLVLVTPARTQPEGSSTEQKKSRKTRPQGQPVPARAVIRFWPAGAGEGDRALQSRAAVSLFQGALPFFKGRARGGVGPPAKGTPLIVGVVTTLEPLTVETEKQSRVFTTDEDVLVVNHLPLKPEALKRGHTVLALSDTTAGADGAVEAEILARCPEPRLTGKAMQKFIRREEGLLRDQR